MKLYHEDCIKVLQSMPNESIDLVVTDPPYLMDFVSHRRKDLYAPIVGDNLGGAELISTYFNECERALKPNTAIYCFLFLASCRLL